MKRTLSITLVSLLAASTLAAQVYPALTPKNAKSMALGGSFTSIPTAEFSFFGNPAAFAAPKASITLISADTWAYIKPTFSNIAAFTSALQKSNPLPALAALMPGNGGMGGGASVGFGYAGNGLGLGAFATTDEYAAGYSIPGSILKSDTEVSAVIGLGLPFKILGSNLYIGGDIRPFFRVRSQAALADIFQTMDIGSLMTNAGFGLAMDLGATLQMGSFGLGVAVRDISPAFPVWTGSFNELRSTLQKGLLPPTSDTSDKAVFLPNVTAGMSWKPRLKPGFIDPAMYLELQDPVSVVAKWNGIGSALNLLHLGAEVRFFNLFTLSGGMNRGWLSAGAGFNFLFFELNAAVFTEELGALPGDRPRSGLALQAAIRF